MADEGVVSFKVSADTKPAEDSLDKLGDHVVGIGKKIGAAAAAYFSFQAIKGVMDKSIDAALDADKALKEFNNSLATTGQYTEAASASFQKYASDLQRATGISDEAILRGASSLVTLGKIAPENLGRVSKATLDLASAMQIDAGSAFDIMTKAANGNVMALSRYGIQIKDGSTNSEKFANILGQLETRFGGLAEKNVDPFIKFKTSLDELFESIGKVFTHSKTLKAAFSVFAGQLDNLAAKFDQLSKGKNFVDTFIHGFFEMGQVITKYVVAPLETLFNFIKVGAKTIVVAMIGIVEVAATVFGKIDFAKKASEIREQFWNELAQDSQTAKDAAVNTAANYVSLFSQTTAEQMRVGGGEAGLSFTTGLSEYLDSTHEDITNAAAGITDSVKNGLKPLGDEAKKVAVNIGGALATAIGGAVKTMATNLAKGQSVFKDFGKMVLKLLGEMATSVGQVLLTTGIGMLALGSLNPYAAIAAGIGLIALGAILSTIGGGEGEQGSSAANPSYTSDVGGSGGAGPATSEERATPRTGVQVIVQGNILNTRESALEIASVLNDAFDLNGTYIRATG